LYTDAHINELDNSRLGRKTINWALSFFALDFIISCVIFEFGVNDLNITRLQILIESLS